MIFQLLLMIHSNGECFHSGLAIHSNLTSMKIRIGLGVLLWTLIFKCNLKIYCCSTFVMKDMYGKSKEDVWWESHFPLLRLGFQRINKAAFRVFCIMSSSSRLLADQDKLNCQSWKSHIWFLFYSENGNSPNTENTVTPKSMYLWHSHCFLLHFKSMMRPSLIIDFQSSAVKVLCSLSCVNCVFLCF